MPFMGEHPEKLKSVSGLHESGSTPAHVSDAQDKNLDFSVSSTVKEVIGALPAEQAKGTAAGSRQQVITKTPQERKAELLARLPKEQERAEKYMKRQVTLTLEKQLDELEGKVHHTSNPYELNLLMAKIRRYRDILADLVHVAFEQLKNLWLQFVHNLSV